MTRTFGRAGALLLLTVSTVGTLLIVAVAGELAVRHRERNRATVPGTMPQIYYQHERLRHALVRSHDYFGWVSVDSLGFRGPEVALDPPAGTVRVLAVGGSTTFDSYVSDDDLTWPARLAAWLNQKEGGPRAEVVNAGVPGYRVLDNLIRFQTELHRLAPDVVILYHTHNDLFAALRRAADGERDDPRRPDALPTVTPWGAWLGRHSLLYAKLVGRWKAIAFAAEGSRNPLSEPQTALESVRSQFARDVRGFVRLAHAAGTRVVLVGVAHVSGAGSRTEGDSGRRAMWQRTMPFASVETVLTGYTVLTEVMADVAREEGVPFIDAGAFGLAGAEWYAPGDPIHFNDSGADRMGRELAAALTAGNLLTVTAGAP